MGCDVVVVGCRGDGVCCVAGVVVVVVGCGGGGGGEMW